jgi:hypothetical protein
MGRRKQPSRRRWLARYRLGRWIPWDAVVAHRLPVDEHDQLARYRPVDQGADVTH